MVCFVRICVEILFVILMWYIDYYIFIFVDKGENVFVL